MKGLYKKRNADNTTNAIVLGFFLIIFNMHSLAVLLEYFTSLNFGLMEFWKPSKIPKVGLGYIGGLSFTIAFLIIVNIVKKSTSEKERRIIIKQIVFKGSKKFACIFYTIFSVLFFLGTILLLITTIIPSGGVN